MPMRSPSSGGATATYVDKRIGSNKFLSRNLGKVFPDHWSFMLGEIALYSFIILLLTGVYLTIWFKPSMVEVVYDSPGPWAQVKGALEGGAEVLAWVSDQFLA